MEIITLTAREGDNMPAINIKKLLLVSIAIFLLAIPIVFLPLPYPKNNPDLWNNVIDIVGYTGIALFGITLVTGLFKKIFKKYPIVHIFIFWSGTLLTGLLMLFISYQQFLSPDLLTGNALNPSLSTCKLCDFQRGDYIAYYDVDKNSHSGELVGMPGDEINNDDKGVIYINGKDSSVSLLSWTVEGFSETIKLKDDEYFVLQDDITRFLSKDLFIQGKTSREYISGKITNYVQPTFMDSMSEENKQLFTDVYQDPYTLFLRQALNAYTGGQPGQLVAPQAIKKSSESGYIIGLDAFDTKYYQSKFLVVEIFTNTESKAFQIIFIDNPDKLFVADIQKLGDNKFVLRNFGALDTINRESLNRYLEYFKPMIDDPSKLL